MKLTTLWASIIESWTMVIVHNTIKVETGHDFRILLYAALVVLAIGLYAYDRDNKETTKSEA